jgi:GNAT superfamily N-acetyltransferase
VEAVARFQTATWRECYAGLVPQTYLDTQGVAQRRVRWAASLASGTRESVLALDDDVVAGTVSWTAEDLESLYVAATHRGTGLADRLLDVALGDRAARLWVFRDNLRARRFYARHGFTVVEGSEQVDPGTGVPEVRMTRPARVVL